MQQVAAAGENQPQQTASVGKDFLRSVLERRKHTAKLTDRKTLYKTEEGLDLEIQSFLRLQFLRIFKLPFFLSFGLVSLNKDRVAGRPTTLAETWPDLDLNGSAVHHQRARLAGKTMTGALCCQVSHLGEEEANHLASSPLLLPNYGPFLHG